MHFILLKLYTQSHLCLGPIAGPGRRHAQAKSGQVGRWTKEKKRGEKKTKRKDRFVEFKAWKGWTSEYGEIRRNKSGDECVIQVAVTAMQGRRQTCRQWLCYKTTTSHRPGYINRSCSTETTQRSWVGLSVKINTLVSRLLSTDDSSMCTVYSCSLQMQHGPHTLFLACTFDDISTTRS